MKRILLIEDDIAIRENTSELLELAQYKVLTACNGREGLEIALKEKPDLIICDIVMPEIDGYYLLQILRKIFSYENIPFLFFTAFSEQSEIKKGLAAGATGFIIKPFDEDELFQIVKKYLGE